jgi:hypothetical protein
LVGTRISARIADTKKALKIRLSARQQPSSLGSCGGYSDSAGRAGVWTRRRIPTAKHKH